MTAHWKTSRLADPKTSEPADDTPLPSVL